MNKWNLLLALQLMLVVGCATAPGKYSVVKDFPHSADYDKVWSAVIDTFAELNLPIANLEKASGLITTDWGEVPGEFCDCGKPGLAQQSAPEGKFNVFVRKFNDHNGQDQHQVPCASHFR